MSDGCCGLLVTANVGTIFEMPDDLLKLWVGQVVKAIQSDGHGFVAIHMQELGGKNFDQGLEHVQPLLDSLRSASGMDQYTASIAVLDMVPKTSSYTALGAIYLVHQEVSAKVYNFDASQWDEVNDHLVLDNSKGCSSACYRRSRFPATLFPNMPNARKGYCHMRWQLNGREVDLVNVHLFHDASNLEALSQAPSAYAVTRNTAIRYVADTVLGDIDPSKDAAFVFGDMNFRLDLKHVVEYIAENKGVTGKTVKTNEGVPQEIRLLGSDDKEPVLVVTGKKFRYYNPKSFIEQNGQEWRQFDVEPTNLPESLHELPVRFEPSYAYAEEVDQPRGFLIKRCPAWCDRILMTQAALDKALKTIGSYDLIGREVCMGDHKPVKLTTGL